MTNETKVLGQEPLPMTHYLNQNPSRLPWNGILDSVVTLWHNATFSWTSSGKEENRHLNQYKGNSC